jgi:hypothetical protein
MGWWLEEMKKRRGLLARRGDVVDVVTLYVILVLAKMLCISRLHGVGRKEMVALTIATTKMTFV